MDEIALWWYSWGVLLFLFVDIVLIAWLTYDSSARRIRSLGWQIAAGLAALLTLPSLIFKFSNIVTQLSMADQIMPFFYLGLIGSVASIIISAAGLAVNSRQPAPAPYNPPPPPPPPIEHTRERPAPPRPTRRKVNAWLVERGSNRNYQLFEGDSRLGRGSPNDVALNDRAVSREHVLIRQEGSHFTLYDRGSRTGTWVNERRIDSPVLLQHGDVILIGDTELEFVTAL
jgi:hypothetical protein